MCSGKINIKIHSAKPGLIIGQQGSKIDELKEKYTIAIVTHSMQQAARVSQHTAYFHLGKLVEMGKTEDIFTRPSHKLTENYITGRFG